MRTEKTVKQSVGLTLDAKAEVEKTEHGFRGDVSGNAEAFRVDSEIREGEEVKESE